MSSVQYGAKFRTDVMPETNYTFDGLSRGFKIIGSYWAHQGRPGHLPPLSACYEATAIECAAYFRLPAGSTALPAVPLGHNTFATVKHNASSADGVHDYYQYFYMHKLVLQPLVAADGTSVDGNQYGLNIFDEAGNITFTTNREMAVVNEIANFSISKTLNNNLTKYAEKSQYVMPIGSTLPYRKNENGTFEAVYDWTYIHNVFLSYSTRPRRYRITPQWRVFTESELLASAGSICSHSFADYGYTTQRKIPLLILERPLAYTLFKNF